MRFVRRIRRSDQKDFDLWFQAVNTGRTFAVGLVLLAFSAFWLVFSLLGIADDTAYFYPLSLYVGFLLQLLSGVVLIRYGRQHRWKTLGEWLILFTAVIWMFTAVDSGMQQGYGLVEFIIGTLALAMLRFMKPVGSAIAFTLFAIGYGLTLWKNGLLEVEPINNGVLFCIFSFMLSIGTYNSKVLEFRNRLLLKQLNDHNRQLATWAMRDGLTDLPNRRYFDQLLEHYWQNTSMSDQLISLILLDIDHFKAFNDRYGHPAGDECLRDVAEILHTEVRRKANCSRLGGEEFAILQVETDQQQAMVLAERLRERIESAGQVTVSLGVATTRPADQTSQAFYISADQALYEAKRRGRNRVSIASRS